MTRPDQRVGYSRFTATSVALCLVMAIGGCAASSSSPSAASSAPATSPPTTAASPRPSDSAAVPSATPRATASPASTEPCPIEAQTGRLPSDRMTGVRIIQGQTGDLVHFDLGPASFPAPPQGPSNGTLEAAVPPFTQAASGLPVDVDGEHVALIRFDGMSLSNDVGQLTYDGPLEFRPDLDALKSVINYDLSEGVIGWYIGYDGDGCLTLITDRMGVTVHIATLGG